MQQKQTQLIFIIIMFSITAKKVLRNPPGWVWGGGGGGGGGKGHGENQLNIKTTLCLYKKRFMVCGIFFLCLSLLWY